MIKKFFVLTLAGAALIYGCKKEEMNNNTIEPMHVSASSQNAYAGHAKGTGEYSASIPVDSANRMIMSYLNSINYPANDSSLRSLAFNADSLRAYLSNPSIKTIRFVLAHQPQYMNSGRFGQFAGMKPEALTMVIVGQGANGDYIRNNHNEVYEHFSPCPSVCNGVSSPYIY